MQNRILFQMLMAATMTFGIQTAANAQFGKLKGLANKAKAAVGDKTTSTVNETKGSASGVGADGSNVSSANGVVWRWEDKTASWYHNMHWNGKQSEEYKYQWGHLLLFYKEIFANPKLFPVWPEMKIETVPVSLWLDFDAAKQIAVPYDEPYRYALAKLLMDDSDFSTFIRFAQMLPFRNVDLYARYRHGYEKEADRIVSKNGWFTPWNSDADMRYERNQREDAAIQKAVNRFPLEQFCDYAVSIIKSSAASVASNQPMKINTIINLFMIEPLIEDVIKQHPKYSDNAECVRQLKLTLAQNPLKGANVYEGLLWKALDLYRIDTVEPQPLPAKYFAKVDATTKAKAVAAAKQYAGDKFVDIYLLTLTPERSSDLLKPTMWDATVCLVTKERGHYVMCIKTLRRNNAKYEILEPGGGIHKPIPVAYGK